MAITEESQMWDVFVRSRYDLFKQAGNLDSCCLLQNTVEPATLDHLPLQCSKCAEPLPATCILTKDAPLCEECTASPGASPQRPAESPKKERGCMSLLARS